MSLSEPRGIQWTNKSVLGLAQGRDPITVIEGKARELVLRARDAGWVGPPFNPLVIADALDIPVEAKAEIQDARIIMSESGLKIQFNPTQARERVRFSIAHEIAHTLFPDVAEEVRNRGGNKHVSDDWQLEMLCNIAAAEFVMPIGSLPGDAEALPDHLPQVHAAPANHAVRLGIGTGLDQAREFGTLLGRQFARRAGSA